MCWQSWEGSAASFVNSFSLWVFLTKASITLFFPLCGWNVNSIFHGAFWTASWIFHLFGVTRHWFWFLDLLSLPQVVWRLSTSQFLSSSLQLSCSVKCLPASARFFYFFSLYWSQTNFINDYLTRFLMLFCSLQVPPSTTSRASLTQTTSSSMDAGCLCLPSSSICPWAFLPVFLELICFCTTFSSLVGTIHSQWDNMGSKVSLLFKAFLFQVLSCQGPKHKAFALRTVYRLCNVEIYFNTHGPIVFCF